MIPTPARLRLYRFLIGSVAACVLATSKVAIAETGIVIRGAALITPSNPESGPAARPSSARKSAPLISAQQFVGAATLAADITSYTMTSEMAAAVKGRLAGTYGQRWAYFQAMNGLEPDVLGRDFTTSRDRGSLRPFMPSPDEELAMRQAMAHSFKDYAVDPALRKLLASRESTKEIIAAVQQVETAARVEVKTEAQWSFTAGGNPFTFASFVGANHPLWTFELHTDWDAPSAFTFVGVRRISPIVTFTNIYTHGDGLYRPILGYQINSRIGTSLGGRYLLKNPAIWQSSYHEVGLSYSF